MPHTIGRRPFGTLPDGRTVDEYVLTCGRLELRAITLGGIITAIHAPDLDGRVDNVVLAHDRLDGYLENTPYLGAIVGRYANRIAFGRLPVAGDTYQLSVNHGRHHLHGGERGFDRHLWSAEASRAEGAVALRLTRTSPDGEQGYPGTLRVAVTYTLTGGGDLLIDYEADTDAATCVNLTQHTYFNLSNDDAQIGAHELTIEADEYTPVDRELIPTGARAAVAATPLDFRQPRRIGEGMDADFEQLRFAGGYDHNWILRGAPGELNRAALLRSPSSGRMVEVWTHEPGLQFYSGNQLSGHVVGAGGRAIAHRAGCCLETQHFPDSPNHRAFPSTLLVPGGAFRSRTIWRFAPH